MKRVQRRGAEARRGVAWLLVLLVLIGCAGEPGEVGEEVTLERVVDDVTPTLAAVLVGSDPASEVYVRNKRRDCEKVGIASQLHELSDSATQEELLDLVAQLNEDPATPGELFWVSIAGAEDEDTPDWSSYLEGAENITVPGVTHDGPTGLPEHPDAYAEVVRVLRYPDW